MKKILLMLALAPTAAFSQQLEGQSVITGGVGYSLLGGLFSISDLDGSGSTESFVTPALLASYDYGIVDNMSIGLAIGYQQGGVKYKDYEWVDNDGNVQIEDFEWKLSRLNVGARALFHYGNNEKLDMYSGARLGYQVFKSDADTKDPDFDTDDFKAGAFGFQLIAFGARGYFTESLGFNFELALGSPYLVMGGLSYRFGGV